MLGNIMLPFAKQHQCIWFQLGSIEHAHNVTSGKEPSQISQYLSRFEFTDELSLYIGQWTICLAVKIAWHIILNQSENCNIWDNYTDY